MPENDMSTRERLVVIALLHDRSDEMLITSNMRQKE